VKHLTRGRRLWRYRRVRGRLSVEDGTHDNAAVGVLVVQICRLGTLPREIPEAAALLTPRHCNVRSSLHAFGRTMIDEPADQKPLTKREREVLNLVSEGCSNA
jgi:ATP/maltotriose-dependent transcriptional regulator MalT